MGYDIVKGVATAGRLEPMMLGPGLDSEQPLIRESRDDLRPKYQHSYPDVRLHEIPLSLEGIFKLVEIGEDLKRRWLREEPLIRGLREELQRVKLREAQLRRELSRGELIFSSGDQESIQIPIIIEAIEGLRGEKLSIKERRREELRIEEQFRKELRRVERRIERLKLEHTRIDPITRLRLRIEQLRIEQVKIEQLRREEPIRDDVRKCEEILDGITAQSLRAFIREKNFSTTQSLQLLQFFGGLTNTNSSNSSKSEGSQDLIYCIRQVLYQILVEELFRHFVSTAVVVICLLEYLMGYIERGGWATYADTSWEFRATYVSIELRVAAYFWFKFRAWPTQPSSADRGQKRSRSELKGAASVYKKGNKFVPKLKAYLPSYGKRVKKDVWLGEFNTNEEAEVVFWIGAFYYDVQDRLNDAYLSWLHELELPPLPQNLSVAGKASWVRETAKGYRTRSRHHDQGLVAVEQYLAPGFVAEVTSGTSEGGLAPMEDFIQNLAGSSGDTDFMLQTNTGRDFLIGSTRDSEDFTVGEIQGEVCGQGVGRAGLNPLGTCPDQSVNNQQNIQHFQSNHGCASVLEGGAEVGASVQQCRPIDDILQRSSLREETEDVLQGINDGGVDSRHVDSPVMSDAGEGGPIPQDARVSASCGGYPFVSEEQTSFMQELAGAIELGHGACPEQDVENLQQSLGSALQLEFGDTDYMPQARSGEIDQADNMTGSFDLGQDDYSQEITVHAYKDVIVNRSREGEVSRLDVGSEGLNLPRTYGDESASHQQGIGQGNIVAEVGALRQDETRNHSALRASADNTQAMVQPIAAQKFNKKRFMLPDRILSTLRELHDEKGVNFSIRRHASTEFSIVVPEGLQLTDANIFALEEIHKQGFEIILESISNASLQDANGRPQSGPSAQDLCRSCYARLSVE